MLLVVTQAIGLSHDAWSKRSFVSLKPLILQLKLQSLDTQVNVMKKRSRIKPSLNIVSSRHSTGSAHLSEQELSDWAGRSAIASSDDSRFAGLGALAFWAIIAAILIARFFFIDPAKLRPLATAPSAVLSEARVWP